MTDSPLARRHFAEWAWFLIGIGAVLRFQGLAWDNLFLFNPDERNLGFGAAALSLSNPVPQFHAYNGLALYAPRLLAEFLSCWTGRAGDEVAAIVFAGRLVSAVAATLTLPVLWSLATNTLGQRLALACLACAVFAPSFIQSAHFATTEAGLVLCLVAVLWLCERHLAGTLTLYRFAIAIGVALGLGFGLKTTALVFAVCPVAAVAVTTLSRGRVVQALSAGMLSLAIVLVLAMITTPQLVAAPGAYFATMRFEQGVVSGAQDVFWTYQFTGARNVVFELSQLPWLLGPVAPAFGLAGLGVLAAGLWRRDGVALRLAPAVALAIVYAGIVFVWHAKFVRYLAPLLPVLILAGGYFLLRLSGDRLRLALALLLALGTGAAGLMQAAIYQYQDPRLAAWDWMMPRLDSENSVVIEPSDLGPPFWEPQGKRIRTLVLPLLEPSTPAKVDAIADSLAAGQWMVVASRRHHGVLPRMAARFPEMCGYYAALWSGRLGYRPEAKFRRRPVLPAWADAETQAEETFTVFDSPEVVLLRKALPLSAGQIKAAILQPTPDCAAKR